MTPTINGQSLTRVKLQSFTTFSDLDLPLSPGLNVFVGENSTGKTHLLKVCYAACYVSSKPGISFAEKLARVFLAQKRALGRLARRQEGSSKWVAEVHRNDMELRASFSIEGNSVCSSTPGPWSEQPMKSVYIPVKDMLANAPGFRSLYEEREIHFEEVYVDILSKASLPILRGPMDSLRKALLKELQNKIGGKVEIKNEEFFLQNSQGSLEFTLLAEGLRKLGLLWVLIQNGTLQSGSALFWDEPETNLNPRLLGTVIEILLQLQRTGVQIFLATHNYVILKEIDLRMESNDKVAFHSLYKNEKDEIACHTTQTYLDIHPNAIAQTFTDLYDREIERSFRKPGS